jgi:hypothetical protein
MLDRCKLYLQTGLHACTSTEEPAPPVFAFMRHNIDSAGILAWIPGTVSAVRPSILMVPPENSSTTGT